MTLDELRRVVARARSHPNDPHAQKLFMDTFGPERVDRLLAVAHEATKIPMPTLPVARQLRRLERMK